MAVNVVWGPALKADYQRLWDGCKITPGYEKYADEAVKMIVKGKARYESIAKQVGCPWWVVGLIHKMEAGCRFDRHQHNGDPLTAKTTHVPAGRPATGLPPFTWEQSALDACKMKGFDKEKDWSIARVLFICEGFNGYGYRQYHPTVMTPYLWAFTNQYIKGKYIADGKWDANCVSKQLGIAAILKHGFKTGAFTA